MIGITLPQLDKDLKEAAAQLKLFEKSPMTIQDSFTRLELIGRALMIRISILELKVAALEEENKKLKSFG